MKLGLLCLAFILLLSQPVSAEIAPIIWSESIQNTPEAITELINIDNYIILKSDRSLAINLPDNVLIKTIDLRRDDYQYTHMTKKAFLFNIKLSDKISNFVDIPLGTHKFN